MSNCVIVPRPEALKGGRGNEQQATIRQGPSQFMESSPVIWDMFQHVEQKYDIPSVAPLHVQKIDVVPRYIGRENCVGKIKRN
jgi:hypothetical protein